VKGWLVQTPGTPRLVVCGRSTGTARTQVSKINSEREKTGKDKKE